MKQLRVYFGPRKEEKETIMRGKKRITQEICMCRYLDSLAQRVVQNIQNLLGQPYLWDYDTVAKSDGKPTHNIRQAHEDHGICVHKHSAGRIS